MDETKNLTFTEATEQPVKGSTPAPAETHSLTRTELLQSVVEGSGESTLGDPAKIGRYRIVGRLGQGGFGRVYLAHDDDLDRPVAIKVPNPERVTDPEDLAAYLVEARILAKLDHPNIVPVHDVGCTEDGLCFVVSKFIEGSDLATRLGQVRPSCEESAELVATIADALHHAHSRGLVHRDIKPANILLDTSGKPCLTDFGLALRDEDFGKGGGLAGTPMYMSPEQARGEGHLVDGRSDIFSLGVVFYELLTGRRPFRGDSLPQIIEQVAHAEPRPPRQIDDSIPKELERICQKAMSKRASERYSTARDMAEDLRLFLRATGCTALPLVSAAHPAQPRSTLDTERLPPPARPSGRNQRSIRIVPKGLRSFDEHDSDFFLELLPGPCDRDGLPEGIRFWKTRIETTDPDKAFRVGLIYGASGCGKSSLIKAGLLPRLGNHVVSVYIEATAEETEARLLRGLHRACPELTQGSGLVDSLAQLRRERTRLAGGKVLFVLDQFEQWLHAKSGEENPELIAALRHCDGAHVQGLLLVRDDFWMAATRFMRGLATRLLEGENSAAVDLFDPRHARKVLAAFGRAYGALPDSMGNLTRDEDSFLDQSISGLVQDGKVIPVRLALFAEMMKGKPWTPITLREVGGTQGVGLTFLEETFSASTAPPEHRIHQKAAQAVLKALLPESGTDIKGQMRSREELLDTAGYANRPRDFDDLMRILDPELRLITPTDSEGSSGEARETSLSGRYYQLAHDYLVHALRDWLTRKQRETHRGRAELRLAERSASWIAKPENRQLPSALEWLNIRMLTSPKDWNDPQRKMMKRAGRLHGLRMLGLLVLVSLIAWAGAEEYGRLRASALVESLQRAETPEVPAIVKQLSGYRPWVNPRLESLARDTDQQSREHLHASLGLLPVDPTQVDYLFNRLLSATPSEVRVLRDALKAHRATLRQKLWAVLKSAKPGDADLLPAASALASYDPDDPRWEAESAKVAQALVSVNAILIGPWIEDLRPVRSKLTAPLASIFGDKDRPETEHMLATNILADYSSEDPDRLTELLLVADSQAYVTLFPVAEKKAEQILPAFQAELARTATYSWNDPPLNPSWTKPDAAVASRIEIVSGMLADRFAFCQMMPLHEFLETAEFLRDSGYRPVRFRPFALGESIRVAAVWTRDGRNWRIASDLSAEQVRKQDMRNRTDRLLPVDIAGYLTTGPDGAPAERYAALWIERAGNDDARMYVGMTALEETEIQRTLKDEKLIPLTLHAMVGSDGRTKYCGTWGRPASPAVTGHTVQDQSEECLEQLQLSLSDQLLLDLVASEASGKAGHLERRYSAVWNTDATFEAISIRGLDPGAQVSKARELMAHGYRPVSWSVARPMPEGPLVAASVWRRPVVREEVKDRLAERQARAAVSLVRMGRTEEVWRLLQHSADPRLRSFLINWLNPLGADAKLLAAELDRINLNSKSMPTHGQQSMDAVLFQPETSERRALILALGTYGTEGLSAGEREPLIGKLLDLARNDPDSGIHGAAEWTLRQWKQQEKLKELVVQLIKAQDGGNRRWYVNGQGQTFAMIEGPVEFRMGSPPTEPKRNATMETPRRTVIPRRFAIASKEVSIEQWQRFARTHTQHGLPPSFVNQYSPDPDGPMIGFTWYIAADYCNWLSGQEGLPRDQWCYLPNKSGAYAEGMTIPADVLQRTGYRLPTEAEWEYACRSGAVTSYSFGLSVELLGKYAWYQSNSKEHAWSCGSLLPNDLGLFDMLGNEFEWTQDSVSHPAPASRGLFRDILTRSDVVSEKDPRILRGGSFTDLPSYVRSANRFRLAPSDRDDNFGFRPARTCP